MLQFLKIFPSYCKDFHDNIYIIVYQDDDSVYDSDKVVIIRGIFKTPGMMTVI